MSINSITPIKKERELYIEWYPTDFCNFHCSYCSFAGNFNKIRYQKNYDIVKNNFLELFNFYIKNYNTERIILRLCGGGEPTLWPFFYRFCKTLKDSYNIISLELVSNGSRTINWWNKHYWLLDQIYLSFHSEYTDIQHYKKVLDFLYEKNVKAECMLMMDTENWNYCLQNFYNLIDSRYPWMIHVKSLRPTSFYNPNKHSQEQIDFLKQSLKRLPASDKLIDRLEDFQIYKSLYFDAAEDKHFLMKQNDLEGMSFKNWHCDILKSRLKINAIGKVTGNCYNGFLDLNLFSDKFASKLKHQNIDNFKCPSLECSNCHNHHVAKKQS